MHINLGLASVMIGPKMETSQSDLKGARHLLRSLLDRRALRTNSLVAPIFTMFPSQINGSGTEEVICSQVLDALGELRLNSQRGSALRRCDRQYLILRRYDLECGNRREIARDLGISLRQFSRERRAGLFRFVAILKQRLLGHPRLDSDFSASRVDLEYVECLKQAGQFTDAITHLRRLARQSGTLSQRLSALCGGCRLCVATGQVAAGQRMLQEAQKLSEFLRSEDKDWRFAQAELSFTCAVVLWATGDVGGAAEKSSKALELLQPTDLERDDEIACLVARIKLFSARLKAHQGDLPAAIADLISLREMFTRWPTSRPYLHSEMLLLLGDFHSMIPGNFKLALREEEDGLRIAVLNGCAQASTQALEHLAFLLYYQGDHRRALQVATRAARGVRLLSGIDQTEFMLELCQIEIACGMLGHAKRHLDYISGHGHRDAYSFAQSLLVETQFNCATREFRAALRTADEAVAAFNRLGLSRLVGMALRHRAIASANCGMRKTAIKNIMDSIDLLEQGHAPFSLAAAYKFGATLTGNKSLQYSATTLAREYQMIHFL